MGAPPRASAAPAGGPPRARVVRRGATAAPSRWDYRAKDDTTSKRRIKVGPNPNYHPYAAGNAMYERFKAHQMMELLNEAKAKRDIIILSEDGDDRKAA